MIKYQSEQEIRDLFTIGNIIKMNGSNYQIIRSEKPRPSQGSGEPKTDAFILLKNIKKQIEYELKLSIKKENADFLENKIRAERAEVIFGEEWRERITSYISLMKDNFYDRDIVSKKNGSITLGWRFEIVNKINGKLSGPAVFSPYELLEVYSGPNLSDYKKHAKLGKNEPIINMSGVAEYIIICSKSHYKDAQEIIDNMVPIKEYIKANNTVYYVCKALNYFTFEEKMEGDRSLGVYINWENRNGELTPEFVFDDPLGKSGNDVLEKLKRTMEELKIKTTNDVMIKTIGKKKYFKTTLNKFDKELRILNIENQAGGSKLGLEFAQIEFFKNICIDEKHFSMTNYNKIMNEIEPIHIFNTNLLDVNIKEIEVDVLFWSIRVLQEFSTHSRDIREKNEKANIIIDLIKNKDVKIGLFYGNKTIYKKSLFTNLIKEIEFIGYNVVYNTINMSEHQIPQNREIVVIVIVRKDIEFSYHFPEINKDKTGLSLKEQIIELKNEPRREVKEIRRKYIESRILQWDDICPNVLFAAFPICKFLHPEGKSFSLKELKRLQTFPDWFDLKGSKLNQERLIASDIPVKLMKDLSLPIIKWIYDVRNNK